ncbi:MAG TPA: hypothetical protein VFS40_16215 [Gemmatimonadales bacterium]|nr:hypothetical protein [Gemmatimonadales bacterium]
MRHVTLRPLLLALGLGLLAPGVLRAQHRLPPKLAADPPWLGGADTLDLRALAGAPPPVLTTPRAPPRPPSPPLDSLLASAGHQGLQILAWEGRRVLDLERLRRRDPNLAALPLYHGLWLRGAASDSLVFDFQPFVTASQRDRGSGASLAYDPGAGLRGWAGATSNSPLMSGLQGAAARLLIELWRTTRPLLAPSAASGSAGFALGDGGRVELGMEPMYFVGTDGRGVPGADTRALLLFAGYQKLVAPGWLVQAGGQGIAYRTPGIPDQQWLGATVRLIQATAPDRAHLFAEWAWNDDYQRLALEVAAPTQMGALLMRPYARLGWGEHLPFLSGFWLGGFESFPGLPPGEGRGDREAMRGVGLSRPLVGRVSLRLLPAVGRVASGGALVDGDEWLAGVRGGVGVALPRVGLVRLEYGIATGHRRAWLVRVGSIF